MAKRRILKIKGHNYTIRFGDLTDEEIKLIEDMYNSHPLMGWKELNLKLYKQELEGKVSETEKMIEYLVEYLRTQNPQGSAILERLKSFLSSNPNEGAMDRLMNMLPFIIKGND